MCEWVKLFGQWVNGLVGLSGVSKGVKQLLSYDWSTKTNQTPMADTTLRVHYGITLVLTILGISFWTEILKQNI